MSPHQVTLVPVSPEYIRTSITRANYRRVLDTKTIEWLLDQINSAPIPTSITIYHVIYAIKAWAEAELEDEFNWLFAALTGTTKAGKPFHYGLKFYRFKWGTNKIIINRVVLVREWGSNLRPLTGKFADFILVPTFSIF